LVQMSHINNLEQLVGSLEGKKILDVGAGWGDFVLFCLEQGYDAVGLELDDDKIKKARERLSPQQMVQGKAENLLFQDSSFDFINIGEVIEHVRDPKKVLQETYRVLKPGGNVYISVHNRFGLYDTHFRVFFLGWMPRSWANFYLSLFNKHKDYIHAIDLHNIQEMHYFTFRKFCKIARSFGFEVVDIREIKINKKYSAGRLPVLFLYKIFFRPLYFSTFHILLIKT